MSNQINFKRVNSDINGNPRYVCSFYHLLSETESNNYNMSVSDQYNLALQKAKSLGGRKYHNKQYGGGIVFGSIFNIKELENKILEITGCVEGNK
jgi:hypothetical protein